MTLTWMWSPELNMWSGEDGGIRLAEVRYAAPGEVEGGLGLLLRFMGGAAGVSQPPPSQEGWYWQGTVEARGVWCCPRGPYATAELALQACEAAAWHRED